MDKYLKELDQNTQAFLKLFHNHPQETFEAFPDPQTWSALGNLEHLLISEKGIIAFMERNAPRQGKYKQNLKTKIKGKVLNAILKSPIKIKVPVDVLSPKNETSFEDLNKEWTLTRKRLLTYASDFPEDKKTYTVFKHPIAGPLTLTQTIQFITLHIARHHRQAMRAIKAVNK